MPKPVITTRSPADRASWILSNTALRAASPWAFELPSLAATRELMSLFLRVAMVTVRDLPDDGEDLDLEAYFAAAGSTIEGLPRWEIDTNRIALGFFSFSKFLMYRDLDVSNWPDEAKPPM